MNRATVKTEENAETVKLPGFIDFIKGITSRPNKPIAKEVIDIEPLVDQRQEKKTIKNFGKHGTNPIASEDLEIKDLKQSSINSEQSDSTETRKSKQKPPFNSPFQDVSDAKSDTSSSSNELDPDNFNQSAVSSDPANSLETKKPLMSDPFQDISDTKNDTSSPSNKLNPDNLNQNLVCLDPAANSPEAKKPLINDPFEDISEVKDEESPFNELGPDSFTQSEVAPEATKTTNDLHAINTKDPDLEKKPSSSPVSALDIKEWTKRNQQRKKPKKEQK